MVKILLLFTVMLACMLIYAVIAKKKEQAAAKPKKEDRTNFEPEEEWDSLEDLFFQKMNSGKKSIRIASIYSHYDSILIKSLLQSAGIPCFFEFENMNALYGGIPMYGNTNIFLNILEEEYAEGIQLLEEFEKTKKELIYKENPAAYKVFGLLLGWYVPVSNLRTLKIYYKSGK